MTTPLEFWTEPRLCAALVLAYAQILKENPGSDTPSQSRLRMRAAAVTGVEGASNLLLLIPKITAALARLLEVGVYKLEGAHVRETMEGVLALNRITNENGLTWRLAGPRLCRALREQFGIGGGPGDSFAQRMKVRRKRAK